MMLECPHCQKYIETTCKKDLQVHMKKCIPTCDWYKHYNEYWKGIIEKDGKVDMNQLKKELFDYSNLMDNASKVYCHITNGMMSKTNYNADTVIAEADQAESDRTSEAIKDELEELGYLNEGESIEEIKVRIRKSLQAFELKPNTLLVVKFPQDATGDHINTFHKVFEEVLNELNVATKAVLIPEGLDVTSYDLTKDVRLIVQYPNVATEAQIKECRKVFEEANMKVVFVPKEIEIKQEEYSFKVNNCDDW